MSTYLYTSNVNENDKICFSYVPSPGTVRYKVNNENGKISVDLAVKITEDNISDETNMVNKTGMYQVEPEVNGSKRLLILLKKLNDPSVSLGPDYNNILVWLILYVKNNLDDTQIPDTFDKERVKKIVNDAIQKINSMNENDFDNYKYTNAAIKILADILHLNSSSSGGFNITRRLFGKRSSKRSNKRSDRDKRNRRTFRTSRSKHFGKNHRSISRR